MYAGTTTDLGQGAPVPYERWSYLYRCFDHRDASTCIRYASICSRHCVTTHSAPIGMQQQPPSEMEDQMLAAQYNQRNMYTSTINDGNDWRSSYNQLLVEVVPTPQQTATTLPPQGVPSAEAVTGVNMKTGKRGKA